MKTPADFSIGDEFVAPGLGNGQFTRWRVTDVGTRTIVAIRVDEVTVDREDGTQATYEGDAAEPYLQGPPYDVLEHVFDEDDLEEEELVIIPRESSDPFIRR
jgi:hypothetical protein